MRRVACSLLFALTLGAGCLGTSPEEDERRALGPEPRTGGGYDEDDGSPEHRPGQPCLVCHREAYHPGDEVFVVAGTVYLRATDAVGLEGAEVTIVDDLERAFTARTNTAGNFMVRVESDLDAPRQYGRGQLSIPWTPSYPLTISVAYDGAEQTMRSVAHREGSCAACHGRTAGAASVGPVYVLDDEAAP